MNSSEEMEIRYFRGKPYCKVEVRTRDKGSVGTAYFPLNSDGSIDYFLSPSRYSTLKTHLMGYKDDELEFRIAGCDNQFRWATVLKK